MKCSERFWYVRAPINAEANKIAAVASQRLLTGVPLITGVQCEEAQLIELIDIKTQVNK